MVGCQKTYGPRFVREQNDMANGMNNLGHEEPEQVEVDDYRESPPSENPLVNALRVTLYIPETLEVRMVDASVLGDYEVWFLISSILAGGVIAFFVAYLQGDGSPVFLGNTLFFVALLIISTKMAFAKRYELRRKSRDIELRVTGAVAKKEE